MAEKLIFNSFKHRLGVFLVFLLCQNLGLCGSLNDEGLALLRVRERVVSDPFGALANWNDTGEVDPCSWFGVECSDGRVVVLNLKDLCLGGTLAPELGNLVHIKSILLRNNSFTGIIPEGIGELKELEVLDLGYNNFTGPLPPDLGSNLSLAILLLDNNGLLGGLSPEIYELKTLSEFQVDENWLSNAAKGSTCNKRSLGWNRAKTDGAVHGRLLKVAAPLSPEANNHSTKPPPLSSTPSPFFRGNPLIPLRAASPSPSASADPSLVPMPNKTSPAPNNSVSPPFFSSPIPSPSGTSTRLLDSSPSKHNKVAILAGAIGGTVFLIISIIGIYLCRSRKVATVKPLATGLSGQLQKAFVTGVPKLKRSELETACEGFSNVIGSSPIGTIYKGTLSNGVEIVVTSVVVMFGKDWSKSLEAQFRKKIDTLSKVNHKNFVNLIGYCEEEEPFTRMMVFEYAPNGTLFEHLHIKEAEHLDWRMRLRIALGMAYCLDHMHQLNPFIPHNNLNSSGVNLTEDYAAKISDFSFWNEIAAAEMEAAGAKISNIPSACPESNVYDFGVILFEMITGRLPYSVNNGSLENWASDYLSGEQPLKEKVDPTLNSFEEEQLERIGEVIKSCVHPDQKKRPAMREVTARLREITGITPDEATPKLSPLWWAELGILSTDES